MAKTKLIYRPQVRPQESIKSWTYLFSATIGARCGYRHALAQRLRFSARLQRNEIWRIIKHRIERIVSSAVKQQRSRAVLVSRDTSGRDSLDYIYDLSKIFPSLFLYRRALAILPPASIWEFLSILPLRESIFIQTYARSKYPMRARFEWL